MLQKVLIATSEINYMPDNYRTLLEELFQISTSGNCDYKIIGLADLRTLDKSLVTTLLKMPFIGMIGMFTQILKNIYGEYACKKKIKLCEMHNIAYLPWKSMNEQKAYEWVKENEIDLIVNLRTRCIYKKKILSAPNLGCINIHHGLLPKYRGTFCDLYALVEKRPAGYSIHKMVKRVDDGEVYQVTKVYQRQENERLSYIEYLKKTIPLESSDLKRILKEIAQRNKLPLALDIKIEKSQISYTQNPKSFDILNFIKKGIDL